jgi:hypothetical protein
MAKRLSESEIAVVVLTLVVILVVIFAGLFSIACSIQTLFSSFLGLAFYAPPPGGIINFLAGPLLVSMAGPPLSWGAALLDLINPNWWLNSYISWYLIYAIVGAVP